MKAVMISIRPEWVGLIASGKKTIEVRKSAPKLETPFKCYIYCTNSKSSIFYTEKLACNGKLAITGVGNGKVIGEFSCDKVMVFPYLTNPRNEHEKVYWINSNNLEKTGLTCNEIYEYGKGKDLYGWHISDLKIYDKPKELSEFYTLKKCRSCESGYESTACIFDEDCKVPSKITRPPQSWCYVEVE